MTWTAFFERFPFPRSITMVGKTTEKIAAPSRYDRRIVRLAAVRHAVDRLGNILHRQQDNAELTTGLTRSPSIGITRQQVAS